MSEEPQLPPLPAIGDILDRKDKFVQKVYTVIKCNDCKEKYTRNFKPGDYTFKTLTEEKCEKCSKSGSSIIEEIYSKWVDPKKEKN
ncbi:MAG: hypothetical protein P8Y70_03095 [Candidatus Lokiarchaeota archaeon]